MILTDLKRIAAESPIHFSRGLREYIDSIDGLELVTTKSTYDFYKLTS